jgi:hypothetical protein
VAGLGDGPSDSGSDDSGEAPLGVLGYVLSSRMMAEAMLEAWTSHRSRSCLIGLYAPWGDSRNSWRAELEQLADSRRAIVRRLGALLERDPEEILRELREAHRKRSEADRELSELFDAADAEAETATEADEAEAPPAPKRENAYPASGSEADTHLAIGALLLVGAALTVSSVDLDQLPFVAAGLVKAGRSLGSSRR